MKEKKMNDKEIETYVDMVNSNWAKEKVRKFAKMNKKDQIKEMNNLKKMFKVMEEVDKIMEETDKIL